MSEKFRVACYIPAHNPGREFERCLASISKSTERPYLLVVDDASSPPINVDFGSLGLTGKVIRLEKNGGWPVAANTALSALKEIDCDYIARIDADDLAMPERFSRQADFLDTHPDIAIVATAAEAIDENDSGWGIWPAISRDRLLRAMAANNCICHPTIMHRKNYADRFGGYTELGVADDYDFFLRAASADVLHVMDDVLTRYRVHTGSISFKKYRRVLFARLRTQIRYMRHTGVFGAYGIFRTTCLVFANLVLPTAIVTKIRNTIGLRSITPTRSASATSA